MQDYFHVEVHGAQPNADGRLTKTMALLVPAGEWRVYGHRLQLDYCIGAPFFAANSGEVVFLGEFDFDSGALNPNVSDQALRRHLPTSLAISTAARAASWQNGATWPCRMELMYALEFDGFPYASDYAWGGAADN